MIKGWTTNQRNITPRSINLSERNSSVVGTIVSLTSTGAWSVEIELESDDSDSDTDHDNDNDHDNDHDNAKSRNPTRKVLVKLNAERHKELEPWMTIRKARKLLSPGVSLLVQCPDDEPSGEPPRIIHAQKIRIIAVVPVTTYLARILSFSKDHLDRLFEHRLNVVHAFRPCTPTRLEELWSMCHQESIDIFKNPRLLELCREIRIDQGWVRGPQKVPTTPLAVWSALERMEERWLSNEAVDGGMDDVIPRPVDDHSQPVMYGGINVDPSLNVPDPTDSKRISYIDQRKRPQVKWMVRTICRLVGVDLDVGHDEAVQPNTEDGAKRIHLIDIGGGRGDLAMAVAACLAQFAITSHVTVLDVNESSLRAAADRAASAGLTNMSFLHQDICDRAGLLSKLGGVSSTHNDHDHGNGHVNGHGPCNLVFGLHCCGGLAEAAVDVALFLRADFCVSTCCFRSHQRLAVLSRTADTLADTNTNTNANTSDVTHGTDRDRVASLAVLLNGPGQHRGIRVLNAMRLAAARYKWSTLKDGRVLETCQETFPMEYSVQNRIMIGVIS